MYKVCKTQPAARLSWLDILALTIIFAILLAACVFFVGAYVSFLLAVLI